jgi:hypothetical protein
VNEISETDCTSRDAYKGGSISPSKEYKSLKQYLMNKLRQEDQEESRALKERSKIKGRASNPLIDHGKKYLKPPLCLSNRSTYL